MGTARFRTPLLFIAGFIFMFVTGGLTGIMFLAIPFDQQVTDTYFVVAHFHYIIFGAAVFPIFGGMYYWFPKVTGKHVLRAPGPDQLLGHLRRDEPPLLPDAHRRPARDAAARRTRTRPGSAGRPTTCSRRSAASSRWPGSCCCSGTSSCSYFRGAPRRPRPVARADAGVDDQLAAARRTTSPSSRRSRAPTRTGTTPTASRPRASSSDGVLVLDAGHEQAAVTPGGRRARRRSSRCRTSRRGRRCSRSRSSLVFAMLVIEKYGGRRSWGISACSSLRRLALGSEPEEGVTGYVAVPVAAVRRRGVVGDGDPDRERGHAVRRADRHVLLPPLPHRDVAAARGARAGAASCPLILRRVLARPSVPMHLASRAVRAGRLARARVLLVGRPRRPGRLLRLRRCTTSATSSQRHHITRERLHLDLLHAAGRRPRARLRRAAARPLAAGAARRGLTPYRANATRGDRMVLALRQRPHDRRASRRCSRRAHEPADGSGSCSGSGSARRRRLGGAARRRLRRHAGRVRRRRRARWGISERRLAGGADGVARRAACWSPRPRRSPCSRDARRTRGEPPRGAAAAPARVHFFAIAAVAANAIFLMIILLDGCRDIAVGVPQA